MTASTESRFGTRGQLLLTLATVVDVVAVVVLTVRLSPIAVILIVGNGVAAVVARGNFRRVLAVVAFLGAVAWVATMLVLPGVSSMASIGR